ncbi:hypothetical protein NDA01_07815 [Trichocoleus desertorum AS-A10]|uniref:tetratricopeptide repeat protein n=1 Tax=Trichocoleus desertorum TaxID=1481672 RepID=UPI0032974AE5
MRLRLILSSLVLAPLLNLIHPSAIALSQEKAELALAEAELLISLAGDYATIGQKNQAIDLLEDSLSLNQSLVEPCPKLRLLAGVAGQYAFVGQKIKSSEIFSQARSILKATKYCEPEPSGSSRSYPTTWIAVASLKHAQVGRYDTAFQVATAFGDQYFSYIAGIMSDSNLPNEPGLVKLKIAIQRRLADFYFRTKEFNEARTIWLALANHYKETRDLEQANRFQNLASKIEPTEDHSLNNQSPEEKAQRTLFECFRKSKLLGRNAGWVIGNTLSPGELKPILDLCRAEKLTGQNLDINDEVFQALQEISALVQRIPSPIKRADKLAAIANIYGSLKKDVEATKLLDEALSSLKAALNLKVEDGSEANSALTGIIKGYLNIQQVDRAIEIAQMVRDGKIDLPAGDIAEVDYRSYVNYGTLTPLIVAFYAEAGQFESALQFANSLDRGHRDEALLVIVQQYMSIGQYTKALQIAETIEELGYQNKAEVIYDILERAIESGNLEWARQATLHLNWKAQATQSIMQERLQASAYSLAYRDRLLLMIAREYTESKQFTQARNTAAQMGVDEFGKVLKAEALSAIARQYAKAGQTKEAVKLLNQAVEIARSISPN